MSAMPASPLKVRPATPLDRKALQEWVRPFALLVDLEGHSKISPNSPGVAASRLQLVVLSDALRVAFAECDAALPEAEPRVFLKPSAWARISLTSVVAAVQNHLCDSSGQGPTGQSSGTLESKP